MLFLELLAVSSLVAGSQVAPIPFQDASQAFGEYHPVHRVLPLSKAVRTLDQRIKRVLEQVLESQAKETTEYWPQQLYYSVLFALSMARG